MPIFTCSKSPNIPKIDCNYYVWDVSLALNFVLKVIIGNDDSDFNGKGAIGLDWKTTTCCTCFKVFFTFPSRCCTTTTGKFLISRFVEDGNKRQQLSFPFPEL